MHVRGWSGYYMRGCLSIVHVAIKHRVCLHCKFGSKPGGIYQGYSNH